MRLRAEYVEARFEGCYRNLGAEGSPGFLPQYVSVIVTGRGKWVGVGMNDCI